MYLLISFLVSCLSTLTHTPEEDGFITNECSDAQKSVVKHFLFSFFSKFVGLMQHSIYMSPQLGQSSLSQKTESVTVFWWWLCDEISSNPHCWNGNVVIGSVFDNLLEKASNLCRRICLTWSALPVDSLANFPWENNLRLGREHRSSPSVY